MIPIEDFTDVILMTLRTLIKVICDEIYLVIKVI